MKYLNHKKIMTRVFNFEEQEKTKKQILIVLLMLLLIFVSVSFCSVEFLIGRIDDGNRYTGRMIDTIRIIISDDTAPFKIWAQKTSFDIFGERAGNSGVKIIDGHYVIAPGSYGSYTFNMQSSEEFDIKYTLKLSESDQNSPKLPLKYRLKEGTTQYKYINGIEWKTAEHISTASNTLPAGEGLYYTLEWKWDTSSDVEDTYIGLQRENAIYILNITINAEGE